LLWASHEAKHSDRRVWQGKVAHLTVARKQRQLEKEAGDKI
jgi:hypothetical protein